MPIGDCQRSLELSFFFAALPAHSVTAKALPPLFTHSRHVNIKNRSGINRPGQMNFTF